MGLATRRRSSGRTNGWRRRDLPLTQVQLVEIRQAWEQVANEHLARAELDIQIDQPLAYRARAGDRADRAYGRSRHADGAARQGGFADAGSTGERAAQRRIDPGKARTGAVDPHRRKERVRPARRCAGAASLYRPSRGCFRGRLRRRWAQRLLSSWRRRFAPRVGRFWSGPAIRRGKWSRSSAAWFSGPTG